MGKGDRPTRFYDVDGTDLSARVDGDRFELWFASPNGISRVQRSYPLSVLGDLIEALDSLQSYVGRADA